MMACQSTRCVICWISCCCCCCCSSTPKKSWVSKETSCCHDIPMYSNYECMQCSRDDGTSLSLSLSLSLLCSSSSLLWSLVWPRLPNRRTLAKKKKKNVTSNSFFFVLFAYLSRMKPVGTIGLDRFHDDVWYQQPWWRRRRYCCGGYCCCSGCSGCQMIYSLVCRFWCHCP